jgi:23S rRNA pseudouridine2605 synthase
MSRKHRHRQNPAEEPTDAGGAGQGPGERLQKVLAAAGVGSRRDCEELIREGRVEVDRQVVTELGTRVDPLRHEIRVDGEALRKPKTLYYAVNKPVGVVTTNEDPDRRTRVIDLVPTDERVFAVGRLDRSSEGLILVTNDGEFANRITHPRYGVEKTYLVRVAGAPGGAELQRLRKGVYLSDGFCRVQSIVPKKRHKGSTDLVIVLNEGRNRELRRILARVGHKVLRLKRIAVGPIKLADLPVGSWRRLMPNEIDALLAVAKEKRREAKRRKRDPRPTVGDSLRESQAASPHSTRPTAQQQALLSEPLSLDDLLRDDLDEGGLVVEPQDTGDGGEESAQGPPGEVIDFDSDEPRPKNPQRPDRQPGKRFDKNRKRFGKRGFGPPREARAADNKGGNFRFRKKPKARRGGKRFGNQSGQQGGRRKGRR